ncbi:MAG: hypothetical protein RR379_04790 [Clostridia bacterium]
MKRYLSLTLALLLCLTSLPMPAFAADPTIAPAKTAEAPIATPAAVPDAAEEALPEASPKASPKASPEASPTAAAPATQPGGADYTLASKLLMQLEAGSGFSGTLTLAVNAAEGKQAPALVTKKPLAFNLDYIFVRPGEQPAEHRLDLKLMDGETEQTAAHFQWMDGALAFQSGLIGEAWYVLDSAAAGTAAKVAEGTSVGNATDATGNAEPQTALSDLEKLKGTVLEQVGMPALVGKMLPLFFALGNAETGLPGGVSDDLTNALSIYTTRIDLWIEGYRQNAVLGKLSDGTTTMEVQYTISPEAIKTQAKQMVLDLLSDTKTLESLQTLLSEEDAVWLLNPSLLNYYFAAIDALPLTGDLTLSRTVSVKGDTLALHLALPMYDAQGGNVTLRYDRVRGEGDLPDDNTIGIENDARTISLAYLEYNSMTDTNVIQGNFVSKPKANAQEQTIAVAFTLKQQNTTGKDDQKRPFMEYDGTLSIEPDTKNHAGENLLSFTATELSFQARFVSKESQKAATEMDATLTLGGEEWDQSIVLSLNGKSRKKWTPDAVPAERVKLNTMPKAELEALLPGIATRASFALLPYLSLPEADAGGTAEPTDGAEATPAASTAP